MKSFILGVLVICSITQVETNPYIGTWKSYDIKSFNERYQIKDNEFSNFESTIIFKEDMSFIKITNNIKTEGKYEFKSNKFKFLELNSGNELKPSWSIRWPKNTSDPSPRTVGIIDLNYPELFTIKNGNGTEKQIELDVYYKKE